MIDRAYFSHQATLLKMAQVTKDPQIAGGLADKAADLQERSAEVPASVEPLLIPSDFQNKFG